MYLFTFLSVFALDPQKKLSQYIIDQWTTKDGLPTNTLSYVTQTKDGFIWVSSYNGLIRFDGVNFTVFDKKNLSFLSNSSISTLYQTKDDSLWIGTHGTGIFNQKNNNFFGYTTDNGYLGYAVESLVADNEGKIWIGTRGNGIIIYENGKFTPFTEIPEINKVSINELQYDTSDNSVIIGTEGKGVFIYQNGSYKSLSTATGDLTDDVVVGLLLDSKKNLWIGGISGLSVLKKGQTAQVEALNGTTINDILEDKYGSIWFATSNGVFRKQKDTNEYEILNTENGLPHNNVMRMHIDREGTMWLAMYRAGLVRIKDGKFVNYTYQQGLASVSISSIFQYDNDTYWIGTDIGIINTLRKNKIDTYPLKTKITADRLRQIFKDKDGNIWVTSYSGLIRIYPDGSERLYTTEDGLTDNQVRVVCQSLNGSIWVGTRAGGLNEYIPSTDEWQKFTRNDGLSSNFILAIEPTSDGRLLVSTNDAGLNIINLRTRKVSNIYRQSDGLPSDLAFSSRYDSKDILWLCMNAGVVAIYNNKIHVFDEKNGFPVDAVFDVREDKVGDLWFSSSQGVIRLSRRSITNYLNGNATVIETTIFDRQDGMKAEECTGAVHFFKDNKGKFWFPTIGGVAVIDPQNIPTNTLPPPVYVTKVQVDSVAYSFPDEKIVIEAGVKRVSFSFTGLSLVSPSDTRFKYRLVGFDDDWIEVVNEREALYTGLAPKNYTFEVMAANNDGIWSEKVASIEIKVKPFFYQTAYFWIIVILAFIGLVYLVYRIQIRRIQRQNEKLEQLVQQRTAEINQQKEEIESQRDRIEEQRQALSESYYQMSLVADIGQKITSTLQTSELTKIIHQNIASLMPAEGFGIGVYHEYDNKIEFKNYIENDEFLPLHSDSLSQVNRLSVQCFTRRKSIFINDLEKYYEEKQVQRYLDIGSEPQSLIYVPLVLSGKTVGVLTVQSFKKEAYSEGDIAILEALAAYVSIARSNAKSYEIIEEKNKNITDSIRYALTIQQAVLPTHEEMNRLFNEYFVIFRPKDIVSGDFYWAVQYKGKTFAAVVDCTGHGVPGGFMSMIANALLNEIVTIERIFSPAKILERLHKDVRNALQQDKDKNDDGMDVSLFCIEEDTEQGVCISFAGAKQSLYYAAASTNEITKIRGDRHSIGGRRDKDNTFTEQYIVVPKGTMIYLMSDGFADQSDLQGVKMGSRRISHHFEQISTKDVHEQKVELETLLEQHQRTALQRDDITLLGIRV